MRAAALRKAERGFTLLELAVVLLIAGVLLTLAAPLLPGMGRTDLEASAERLAATMTWLADEASLRGRVYRLSLDLDSETWEVTALAPFAAPEGTAAASSPWSAAPGASSMPAPVPAGTWQGSSGAAQPAPGSAAAPVLAFGRIDDDPMARTVRLPDGVALDIVRGRDGDTTTGRIDVHFLPEGSGEGLAVRLVSREGATSTVVLDATRGSARREETVEAGR